MYEDINGLFYKFRNFSNSSDNKKRFKDLFIKLYINDYDDFYFINLKSFIKLLKNTNPVFLKSIEYILKKKNNFFNNKKEEYHSIFDDSNKSFDRMITESIDDHNYKYYCIEFNDGLDNLYSNINEDDYELILPLLGEFIYNSKDEFNSSIINQKELNLAKLKTSNPFKINDISFFNKKRIDEDNYQLILKKESIKNPFEFDFYLSKDKDNKKRIIIKNTGIETA